MSYYVLVVEDANGQLNDNMRVVQSFFGEEAIVLSARTTDEARQQASNHQLKLAIVDLHLPKEIDGSESVQNGKDLLANLMKNYPNLHLVVLTGRRRESLVTLKNEIDNHQGGFVIASKDCSELDLKEYIDSTQRRYKLTQIIREGIELTPEEYKVLKLMSEGKMNVQIAKAMFIDDKKVGRTITSIYGKLGVPTESNARLFAINRAREIGLLD